MSYINASTWNVEAQSGSALVCRAGMETQMQRLDMWPGWGKGGWGDWEAGPHIYTVCAREGRRGAAAEPRSPARALGGPAGGCGRRGSTRRGTDVCIRLPLVAGSRS